MAEEEKRSWLRLDWRPYLDELIGSEISNHSLYFDAVFQALPRPHDGLGVFRKVQCLKKLVAKDLSELKTEQADARRLILLNGNLNHHEDVEKLLTDCKAVMQRGDRLTAVVYSSYFSGLYLLATKLGLREGELPSTRFTQRGLETIAKLAGFEITRKRPLGFLPFRWLGLGSLINRVLQATPFLRWFGLVEIVMLRPVFPTRPQSISILIPARNEKGNLEAALARLPEFSGMEREVVFVEGHSADGTWEEILRLQNEYRGKLKVLALQQPGRGKADAVRFGLAQATGELLTILDADLTVPPEYLPRFVNAYAAGLGDFVNGTRLLYPAEGKAMRFLNWLGNIFFAKALSLVLDSPLGDSLCGTKLFTRRDYERFCEWRKDFGEFDPFGDFELLFPAAVLGLGSIDIPVRYRARIYGSTNISRFRDGWTLLKMTTLGMFRIRLGNGT